MWLNQCLYNHVVIGIICFSDVKPLPSLSLVNGHESIYVTQLGHCPSHIVHQTIVPCSTYSLMTIKTEMPKTRSGVHHCSRLSVFMSLRHWLDTFTVSPSLRSTFQNLHGFWTTSTQLLPAPDKTCVMKVHMVGNLNINSNHTKMTFPMLPSSILLYYNPELISESS